MNDKQLTSQIQIKMLELAGLSAAKLMRTRQDVIDAGQTAQLEFTKQATGTCIKLIEEMVFPKLNIYYGPKNDETKTDR
jgi:hypothetical protein